MDLGYNIRVIDWVLNMSLSQETPEESPGDFVTAAGGSRREKYHESTTDNAE